MGKDDPAKPCSPMPPEVAASPVQHVWQCWRQQQCPDFDTFGSGGGPLDPTQALAVLRFDQHARWRSGERMLAETYLHRYRLLREDGDAACVLIYSEFLFRQELGEAPALDEYLLRFPRYAAELREQHVFNAALLASSLPAARSTMRALPASLAASTDERLDSPKAAPHWPTVAGYEIVDELGRGGMGIVYKARQLGLQRVVALKMLRPSDDASADQLRRFAREAEAVARLQHPHIVQIHEVGHQDSRPYFALEYVDGGSLDKKLAGKPQPGRPAARLVALLAQAMHAAHQHKIVHRDLKPANILLSGGADTPLAECLPKITDFGLAKELNVPLGQTQSGVVMGTPSYMAPEQASGRSKGVGPAADVYALGAVLYEMLTGRPPFQGETALDILQQVVLHDPVPPRILQPKVSRDLETICLKCLQKQPDRRYASAEALAQDLRRFLATEPIQARPVGRVERLGRWCRRKPAVASLTFTLLLFVVAGFAAVTGLWLHAQHQRDRAEANFHRALQAVESYLTSVGESPELKAQGLEKLRQTLLASAQTFYEGFVRERPGDADVRRELGNAYRRLAYISNKLGETSRAADLYTEMQHIFAVLVREHPEDPVYQQHLALSLANRAVAHRELGRWTQAEADHEEALQLRTRLVREHPGLPEYVDDLASSQQCRADLYYRLDRLAEAEAAYQAAQRLHAQLVRDHPDIPEYRSRLANTHDLLAGLFKQTGRLREAEASHAEGRQLREQLCREHPGVPEYQNNLALSLSHLGDLYKTVGRHAEAIAAYQEVGKLLAPLVRRHPYVDSYQESLAESQNLLGDVYVQARQWAEAQAAFQEARESYLRLAGARPEIPNHQLALAMCCLNLGIACYRKEQRAEAEKGFQEARDLLARLVRDHPNVPNYQHALSGAHNSLANVYYSTGRFAAAEDAFQAAIKIQEKLVHDHPTLSRLQDDLAASRHNLANVYSATGRVAEAEKTYRQAQPIWEKLAHDHPRVPKHQSDLANLHYALGLRYLAQQRWPEAAAAFQELQKLRARLWADHPDVPTYAIQLSGAYACQGFLLRRQGEFQKAQVWFARALEALDEVLQQETSQARIQPFLVELHWNRALNLKRLGRHADALQAWDRAAPLAKGADRDGVRALRAGTVAALGEHTRAAEEVRDLTERRDTPAGVLYKLAGMFATCAAAAQKDSRLPEAERDQLVEHYAAGGVVTLTRADTAGYFKDPEMLDELKTDTDLDSLRPRADFQKLLQQIVAKQVPKAK